MSYLANSSAPRKNNFSTVTSTGDVAASLRRWWSDEASRAGSDWRSVLSLHFEISDRLRASFSSWSSS
jgi:hypothetical protein